MPIDFNSLPSNYFHTTPANSSGVAASTSLTPLGLINAYEQHAKLNPQAAAELQQQENALTGGLTGKSLTASDPRYAQNDYLDAVLRGQAGRAVNPFHALLPLLIAGGVTGFGALGGAAAGGGDIIGGSGSNALLGSSGADPLLGGGGAAANAGLPAGAINLGDTMPWLSEGGGSGGFMSSIGNLLTGGGKGSSAIPGATILSGLLSAGGQIYGANAASNAQKGAAAAANERLAPYSAVGSNAAGKLNDLITNPQTGLESLPGYKFTRDQGLLAVQNQLTSQGLGKSGPAVRGAADYATGLADSTYGSQFNRLLELAGLGDKSASAMGNFQTNAGNAGANNYLTQGNAVGTASSSIPTSLILQQYLARANNGNQTQYTQG